MMRSRYKHFHDQSPYFITCTTVNWIPVFTSRARFDMIVECLQFLRSIEYIHNNPVRRGYVDEPAHWIYSSARNYLNDDHSVLLIDTMELW
ncbi:MAG: hypothetical protein E3K37_12535 [Candidatus Kuenenia sp.]|nr:hypothetical protein [Candidatus Kuenenia hertensis]